MAITGSTQMKLSICSTVQYSAVHWSTASYSGVQQHTVQYNIASETPHIDVVLWSEYITGQ